MSQISNDVSYGSNSQLSQNNDNERQLESSLSTLRVSESMITDNVEQSSQTSHSFDAVLRRPQSMDNNARNATQMDSVFNSFINNRTNNELTNGVNMNYFFELMKSESNRLISFTIRPSAQWSLTFISPEDLANAGFFYLNGDRVQCAFCRGEVYGWEAGDRPLAEHARHFPRCPFIMECDVGNIPIAYDPMRGPKITRGHDVCGNYTPTLYRDPVLSSISAVPNGDDSALPLDMRAYGVQPHRGPKNPNYSSIDARKRSFVTNCWNNKIPVGIDSLAESGFFCIGMMDYVKCFYCDGGLCNWEKGDEPWIEHAKWFPECEFVRLNKSQTFIDECRSLADTENASNNEQNNIETTSNSTNTNNTSIKQTNNENDETSDVSLGLRAVNEWLGSDIVRQLIDLKTFPIDVIKATLNRRWYEEKQQFQSFAQLYDAVSHQLLITQPTVEQAQSQQTTIESEDESYFSASQSSSSQSSNSSQESSSPESPTSSQKSLTLSIPESTLSEESSLSDSPKSDDNRLLCKICLDREIGVVFLPCGHQLACTQCAPCCADCPICRQPIRGTVRTFFS